MLHRLLMFSAAIALGGCGGQSTAPSQPPSQPPSPPVPEGLWTVSGSPAAILRLSVAQLSDTGNHAPATRVTTLSARLNTLAGVAFAPDGTLWISSADDSLLLAFAPAVLATSGGRAATTVIAPTGGSLGGPTGLAFDRAGRLWVANSGNGTLVRFDSSQLVASGVPAPAVVLSGAGQPTTLAFDAAGSLWVSDNQANRIARYDSSQLLASGSPAPVVVLTAIEGSLRNPTGLAFDTSGNLWVSNVGGGTVVAFSPAQLAPSGSPVPGIVLSGSLSVPVGLAFDGDGNLWVVAGSGALTQFDRARLGASGAPTPTARITVSGHSLFWSAAFWPRPSGFPPTGAESILSSRVGGELRKERLPIAQPLYAVHRPAPGQRPGGPLPPDKLQRVRNRKR